LLLLIMAVTGLGVGALTLSRRQAVAARTGERVLQAMAAAAAGIELSVERWVEALAIPVGGRGPVGSGVVGTTGSYATSAQRLGRELWLVESAGRHTASGTRHRLASAVWRLDGPTRVGQQGAAVVHGGGLHVSPPAEVSGSDAAATPSGWSQDLCTGHLTAIDSLFPLGILPSDAPLAGLGRPAWEGDLVRDFDPVLDEGQAPGLGLIGLDSLISVGAELTPTLSAPSPPCPATVDIGRPECGLVDGLLSSGSSVTVVTGSAAGILAVEGDLTITGDAHVIGWILVSGSVIVSGNARVDGFVRAAGQVRVEGLARVVGSPCAGLATLFAPWLLRPRFVPGGALLGPLA